MLLKIAKFDVVYSEEKQGRLINFWALKRKDKYLMTDQPWINTYSSFVFFNFEMLHGKKHIKGPQSCADLILKSIWQLWTTLFIVLLYTKLLYTTTKNFLQIYKYIKTYYVLCF